MSALEPNLFRQSRDEQNLETLLFLLFYTASQSQACPSGKPVKSQNECKKQALVHFTFFNHHHYCFNALKNYQLLQGQLSDPLQLLYAGLLPCFLATYSNLPSLQLIYGPPSPHPLLTGERIKTDKSKPHKLLIRL